MTIFFNQKPTEAQHITALVGECLVAIGIENIGPDEAMAGLAVNTHNRRLKPRLVNGLTRDFSEGNYVFSGAPIVFSDQGVLLDGQHRLTAIANSGITVPLLVVRGVKASVQTNIDNGARRTVADALTLLGYADSKNLAALARLAFLWDAGQQKEGPGLTPTNTELINYVQANPCMMDCLPKVETSVRKWRMNRSRAALACWLFSRIDSAENDAFWELMRNPHHEQDHPVGALQARYLREAAAARGTSGMSRDYELALLIKTWNAYVRGERIGQLRWRAGGANPEPFPQPLAPIA